MDFIDFSDPPRFKDDVDELADFHQQNHYEQEPQSHYTDQQKAAYYSANLPHQMVGDIKPRLTKEQHDILEAHYQKQAKPNTNIKKGFAEALNVSLEKVNNWFQNRRAKSKQDAKKQAGAFSLFQAQQAAGHIQYSDPEISPAFSSPDYFSMMQDCAPSEQSINGLRIYQMGQFQEQGNGQGMMFPDAEGFMQPGLPQQMPPDLFDSPQEMNRRTMTQEQFDALAQHNPFLQGSNGDLSNCFHPSYSQNGDVLGQVFPELTSDAIKQQDVFSFTSIANQPLSSVDSTVPSTSSESSFANFPASSQMPHIGSMSTSSSEWSTSRSSSIAMTQVPPQQQLQHPTTTSQWQPGQSVPVDFNALSQEFQQAARAKQSPTTHHQHEQPLAWPEDEAYARRESSASMLTQSMSNVGIHTPQIGQHANSFKPPVPPSSIAARRQRPRPATLGLGNLRSQSYGGAAAPGSPGQHLAPPGSLTPNEASMRRVKSTAILNGRVQKSVPSSAQRSPLNWTFTDAMNSPKVARHVLNQSNSNLAPPTPMSPNEFPRPEPPKQWPPWQSASGHTSRQPSVNEHDIQNSQSYAPVNTAPLQQNFSSPPSTPAFHGQQQFMHHPHFASPVLTENTPPQSAPAAQQCFPFNAFAPPPQAQHPPQPQRQQHMQPIVPSHSQHFVGDAGPEAPYQMHNVTFAPLQSFPITTSSPPMELPTHYAPQVPIVNGAGQLQLAFPPQTQFSQPPPQQMQIPQQPQQHQFITSATPSPGIHITAQMPKHQTQSTTEFFVHEYSPPRDIKRATTPRKLVDTGPKNYTFANQGPEHFEKGKKGSQISSAPGSSPASSNGTNTTS